MKMFSRNSFRTGAGRKLAWGLLVLVLLGAFFYGREAWNLAKFLSSLRDQETFAAARGPEVVTLAQACAGCHGREGNSSHAFYPRLAGQPADYLEAQLNAFAAGNRSEPMMEPLANALSPGQRHMLAQYFSTAALVAGPGQSATDQASREKGKVLAVICTSCHGAEWQGGRAYSLRGEPIVTPLLAGQSRDYLIRQLRAFRTGARKDVSGSMNAVVGKLGDDEVSALADFLSTHAFSAAEKY